MGALVADAVLALLAWQTLSDEKLRLVTMVILAGLAVKTALHRNDQRTAERRRIRIHSLLGRCSSVAGEREASAAEARA
jgi:hypothetical protein